MKTITCFGLLMLVALTFASALPAPDGDANLDSSEVHPPAAMQGEELETDESRRWGYGWGRGWGGPFYPAWARGYGGWGRGYGGWGLGWGRGWGLGYGR